MPRHVCFEAYHRTGRACTIEVEGQVWTGEGFSEEGKKGRRVIWSDNPAEYGLSNKVFELLGVRLKVEPLVSILQGNDEIRCFFTVDKDGVTWNTEASQGMEEHMWDMLDDILASPAPFKEIEEIATSLTAYIKRKEPSAAEKKKALALTKRLVELAEIVGEEDE